MCSLGSLTERLAEISWEVRWPPERQAVLRGVIAHIEKEAPGLAAGDLAPDFTLPAQDGRLVTLSETLAIGPVVLAFFRGDWCPYCDLLVRAYDECVPRLRAKGATMLAVSPQAVERGAALRDKHDLSLDVLSDHGLDVAARYQLRYETPADMRAMVLASGLNLAEHSADGSWQLPATATFVIGADRRIIAAGVTADPAKRMDPEDVLRALGG